MESSRNNRSVQKGLNGLLSLDPFYDKDPLSFTLNAEDKTFLLHRTESISLRLWSKTLCDIFLGRRNKMLPINFIGSIIYFLQKWAQKAKISENLAKISSHENYFI